MRAPARRAIDVRLLLASLGIAVGIVLVAIAFLRADDGGDDPLPAGVEELSPVPNAIQAVAQTQVIADLDDGYEGELVIDGERFDTIRLDDVGQLDVEPGAQVDIPPGVVFEPGNATLTFTPSASVGLERFGSGRHEVRLIYWPSTEGRGAARTFTWSFDTI